jgi:acetyl-CoA carboxylase carboxyl transferase subunit beta
MPRIPAVGAVVAHPDGRVLLIRRARAPSKGEWTLPGGKLEPAETLEDAVVREVHEETALAIRVVRKLTIYVLSFPAEDRDEHAYDIHEFLCSPVDPSAPLTAADDAADARWATLDELEDLGVRADAIAVIRLGLC